MNTLKTMTAPGLYENYEDLDLRTLKSTSVAPAIPRFLYLQATDRETHGGAPQASIWSA